MKYIYNRIVTGEDDTIVHFGSEYRRTGKNHMGNIDYYTYYLEGAEPILVIPTFAVQFKEVIEAYFKIRDVHTNKAVKIRLKAMFGKRPEADGFLDDGVEKYSYTVKYKDIEVHMSLEGGILELQPYFRILSNKVIDNKKNINVEDSPEFLWFFHPEMVEPEESEEE